MKIKTQKFSFSLLLCIILAVLTALSFVLSFSGAWFTSSKTVQTDNISLRFGSVRLGENFNSQTVANMVPTETIAYYGATTADNIVYNGTVDAYYRIKFDVTTNTLSGSAYTEDAYSETFEKLLDFNTTSASLAENNQLRDDWSIYGKVSQNGYIPKGTLRLSSETPNLFENKEFRVKVTIDLFQAQNINFIEGVEGIDDPDAEDDDVLLCYQNLFYFNDWGTVAETENLDYTPNSTAPDYSTNKTCYVSGIGSATPGTTLKIPQVVTINGVKHKVTGIGKTDSGVTASVFPNTISRVVMSPFVIDVGDYAFDARRAITRVVYSPNLTSIGTHAFYNCVNLINCDLAGNVSTIKSSAFYSCGLYSLKVPQNPILSTETFYSCNRLIMIVFGENSQITSLNISSYRTFGNFQNLIYLVFPKSITSIYGGLSSSSGECNIQTYGIVENSVYYSKNNCIIRKSDNYIVSAPTNCTIPSEAVGIANEAIYYNYTRTEITIPSNINAIVSSGIRYMHGLTTVNLENPNISLTNGSFNCREIVTVNFNGTRVQLTNRIENDHWTKSYFNSRNLSVTFHCTDDGAQDPIVL